ncbi:MAG: hypothetical protein IAE87_05740 [Rhodobacteraceae bacterium]|jgi:hypothetical protein|nr:hypothetical protein [Paracoccaceae bacterium]
MSNVYVRMFLYVLSPLIAMLAAMLSHWGVGYADGVLSVDIEALARAAVAAFGLSGAVFARWGVR